MEAKGGQAAAWHGITALKGVGSKEKREALPGALLKEAVSSPDKCTLSTFRNSQVHRDAHSKEKSAEPGTVVQV